MATSGKLVRYAERGQPGGQGAPLGVCHFTAITRRPQLWSMHMFPRLLPTVDLYAGHTSAWMLRSVGGRGFLCFLRLDSLAVALVEEEQLHDLVEKFIARRVASRFHLHQKVTRRRQVVCVDARFNHQSERALGDVDILCCELSMKTPSHRGTARHQAHGSLEDHLRLQVRTHHSGARLGVCVHQNTRRRRRSHLGQEHSLRFAPLESDEIDEALHLHFPLSFGLIRNILKIL
mmetsp:Transcript_38898/g.103341  ORF Transcript_38898/g.103341 Transcript_38898/m.103341 type:complete len:233 (-) Transcript_38898:367-1065(-)